MPFKINKKVTVQMCIMPTALDKDGILYWPRNLALTARNLLETLSLFLEYTGKYFFCSVKEANVESSKSANKLCSLYSTLPDTDAEIECFSRTSEG